MANYVFRLQFMLTPTDSIHVPYTAVATLDIDAQQWSIREQIAVSETHVNAVLESWPQSGSLVIGIESQVRLSSGQLLILPADWFEREMRSDGWEPTRLAEDELGFVRTRLVPSTSRWLRATTVVPISLDLGILRPGFNRNLKLFPADESELELRVPRYVVASTFPPPLQRADRLADGEESIVLVLQGLLREDQEVRVAILSPLLQWRLGPSIAQLSAWSAVKWIVLLICAVFSAEIKKMFLTPFVRRQLKRLVVVQQRDTINGACEQVEREREEAEGYELDAAKQDSAAAIAGIRSSLKTHVRLIDRIIASFLEQPGLQQVKAPASLRQTLVPMLQTLGSSANTLMNIGAKPGLQTRDCYPVCRAVVEAAVNICYIVAEGESAAEAAMRHARSKTFLDMERESTIGGRTIRAVWSGRPDPDTVDGVQESIAEFTSKSGREKGWTDLSIDTRIEQVGQYFGEKPVAHLHWARFMVYRHSSEILHGTLFGALYSLGITEPVDTTKDLEGFVDGIASRLAMVLLAALLALRAVVYSVHQRFGLEDEDQAAEQALNEVAQIPWLTGEE
jgi:hypothetical protein